MHRVCFGFDGRLLVVIDSDSSWLGVLFDLFWVLYCLCKSFVVWFACCGFLCLLRLLLECFPCFVGLSGAIWLGGAGFIGFRWRVCYLVL